MNQQVKFNLLALLTIAVWGVTFVSTKILLSDGMTPTWVFISRFAIAYVCVLALSHKRLWADSLRDEMYMLAMGLTGGSLYFIAENTALGLTYASNVSLIICTAPILTMIIDAIKYNRRISVRAAIGSIMAMAGVAIVVMNGSYNYDINPLGDLLTLLAALFWAIYCLMVKYMNNKYSNLFITRKVFFYGCVSALIYSLTEPRPELPAPDRMWQVGVNLLFLGVMASFVCYILWNNVVKILGAVKATNYIYFIPVITIIASSLVLDEPVSLGLIAGGAIIVSGVYLSTRN